MHSLAEKTRSVRFPEAFYSFEFGRHFSRLELLLETGDEFIPQTEAGSRRLQEKLLQIIGEALGCVVRFVFYRLVIAGLEKGHRFVGLNGVFPLAGITRRGFGARRGFGPSVTPGDERVLVVVDRVERVGRAVAYLAAQLAVLLVAVVAAVAVHVVVPGLVLGVGAARAAAPTLGTVVARDAPQLLQELVVDLEVLGVRLRVVSYVGVGRVAARLFLLAGRLGLAAGVRVVGGVAGRGRRGRRGGRRGGRGVGAVRAEGDGLVSAGAGRAGRAGLAGRAGAGRGGRARQGSGLHGGDPQCLVLLLLDGGFNLRARVRDVYARGDFS